MWLVAIVIAAITVSRLPHTFTPYSIKALPTRVNIHLSCIHKGLTALSSVTPLIQTNNQTILTRSFEFDV